MLSIRLSRKGKKKYPVYSLIVLEKSKDPWGDYLEKLGTFNPHTKEVEFNGERIEHWIKLGAQPTATVHNLLVSQGIIKADKVRAGKSQPGKKRKAEIEATKKAEETAKAKAEEEAKAAEEAAKAPAVEEVVTETPAEVTTETAESVVAEEVKAEAPAEEIKTE
jgi:small subunit ribosomal protein S16